MKTSISAMFTVLILAASALANPMVELTLSPQPPHNFEPPSHHNESTNLSLSIKDAQTGAPIKDCLLDLSLAHDGSSVTFSTGFPYVEGKQQFALTGVTAVGGHYDFTYMFPIRGRYRLDVKVYPPAATPKAFEPFATTLDIPVSEQPFAVHNAIILCTLIFGIGFFSAFLLKRWNHQVAMLLFCSGAALALLTPARPASAHMGHHDDMPQAHDAMEKIGTRTSAMLTQSIALPAVGQLTHLSFDLKDLKTHKGISSAAAELSLVLEEDKLEIYKAPLRVKDGRLALDYSFMDGSDHQLTLKLWRASDAEPETFQWTLAVEAIEPPKKRIAFSLSILAGILVVGMGLGLWAGGSRTA